MPDLKSTKHYLLLTYFHYWYLTLAVSRQQQVNKFKRDGWNFLEILTTLSGIGWRQFRVRVKCCVHARHNYRVIRINIRIFFKGWFVSYIFVPSFVRKEFKSEEARHSQKIKRWIADNIIFEVWISWSKPSETEFPVLMPILPPDVALDFPLGNPLMNRFCLPVLCGEISVDINAMALTLVGARIRNHQDEQRRDNDALILNKAGLSLT